MQWFERDGSTGEATGDSFGETMTNEFDMPISPEADNTQTNDQQQKNEIDLMISLLKLLPLTDKEEAAYPYYSYDQLKAKMLETIPINNKQQSSSSSSATDINNAQLQNEVFQQQQQQPIFTEEQFEQFQQQILQEIYIYQRQIILQVQQLCMGFQIPPIQFCVPPPAIIPRNYERDLYIYNHRDAPLQDHLSDLRDRERERERERNNERYIERNNERINRGTGSTNAGGRGGGGRK